MNRHRKNKKITMLKYANMVDKDNIPRKEYIPMEGLENIWAYYRHLSGKEFFAAHATNSKVEVMFEINWNKKIAETNPVLLQVLYNNEKYYVTQIDDFEGRKTDLKLYAYKIN